MESQVTIPMGGSSLNLEPDVDEPCLLPLSQHLFRPGHMVYPKDLESLCMEAAGWIDVRGKAANPSFEEVDPEAGHLARKLWEMCQQVDKTQYDLMTAENERDQEVSKARTAVQRLIEKQTRLCNPEGGNDLSTNPLYVSRVQNLEEWFNNKVNKASEKVLEITETLDSMKKEVQSQLEDLIARAWKLFTADPLPGEEYMAELEHLWAQCQPSLSEPVTKTLQPMTKQDEQVQPDVKPLEPDDPNAMDDQDVEMVSVGQGGMPDSKGGEGNAEKMTEATLPDANGEGNLSEKPTLPDAKNGEDNLGEEPTLPDAKNGEGNLGEEPTLPDAPAAGQTSEETLPNASMGNDGGLDAQGKTHDENMKVKSEVKSEGPDEPDQVGGMVQPVATGPDQTMQPCSPEKQALAVIKNMQDGPVKSALMSLCESAMVNKDWLKTKHINIDIYT